MIYRKESIGEDPGPQNKLNIDSLKNWVENPGRTSQVLDDYVKTKERWPVKKILMEAQIQFEYRFSIKINGNQWVLDQNQ